MSQLDTRDDELGKRIEEGPRRRIIHRKRYNMRFGSRNTMYAWDVYGHTRHTLYIRVGRYVTAALCDAV